MTICPVYAQSYRFPHNLCGIRSLPDKSVYWPGIVYVTMIQNMAVLAVQGEPVNKLSLSVLTPGAS